jgi:hypothetical protein
LFGQESVLVLVDEFVFAVNFREASRQDAREDLSDGVLNGEWSEVAHDIARASFLLDEVDNRVGVWDGVVVQVRVELAEHGVADGGTGYDELFPPPFVDGVCACRCLGVGVGEFLVKLSRCDVCFEVLVRCGWNMFLFSLQDCFEHFLSCCREV